MWPKQEPTGRISGDFRIHKLEKFVGGGEGKKKYPARQCKVCVLHITSEVILETFVLSALFHYGIHLGRNKTRGTTRIDLGTHFFLDLYKRLAIFGIH
jgi:hypothetical protein